MFGINFFNDMAGPPRPFKNQYRCYSVSMLPGNERNDLEHGGKIIMPPSALDQLTRLNIVYPMLFKLTNHVSQRTTHCGVLEFVADEGMIYIPYWMMQNLTCEEGGLIQVESASLPVASFAKFQPHSTDFLDLTNPKAVLESRLRNFACLSKDDVIAIQYNNKVFEVGVLETKPADAVSVIECDLNVDFAPPVGYQEPASGRLDPSAGTRGNGGGAGSSKELDDEPALDVNKLLPERQGFVPFVGSGNRLDGKNWRIGEDSRVERPKQDYVRGIPDYEYEVGLLTFIRNSKPPSTALNGKEDKGIGFSAFKGEGKSLRQSNKGGNN